MIAANPASDKPLLSVIVPARNEEVCLGACLQSLVSQSGVSFEIIVVDDGSTDRTREIALSFSEVRVIEPGPLPPGWIGKNNAVAAGAAQAAGDWLLFTDADTVHLPGSMARSLQEAQQQGAALLSYSPQQEAHGFWEKAIMPVIFSELASHYRPSEVSDPNSPAAAANGQYILIRRDAYDSVGGHTAIATNLLEDVTLARAVKSSGRKIIFRYGGDAVRARMYRSFAQLREGWTKNLALLFAFPLLLGGLKLAEFVAIIGWAAFAIASFVVGRTPDDVIAATAAVILYIAFLWRIQKAHFGWPANLCAIAGLPVFSYLLFRSRLSLKQGTVVWKGRTYGKICGETTISVGGSQANHTHPSTINLR